MRLITRVKRAIGTASALLAFVAVAPGVAVADVEPNSDIFRPEAPAVVDGEMTGTLSGEDRHDWYVFYVSGAHQIHFTGQAVEGCATLRLTDRDGQPIASDYTSPPGTTRFFVHAELVCPGATQSYSFRLEPAEAFVPGPGLLALRGTLEPNDVRGDAYGPLAPSAWYFSGLETVNDEDWFRFYTHAGRQQVELEVVTYGPQCPGHRVSLIDARGRQLTSAYTGGVSPITRLAHAVRGGQRLYVHVGGNGGVECVGAKTVLHVGSDDAVMDPGDVRTSCAKGRSGERRAARRIVADRRALALHGSLRPRVLTRKLARHKRDRAAARRQVKVYCS
jgi:hypothetical protein